MMVTNNSDKLGMIPGSLIYVGRGRPSHEVKINLIQYNLKKLQKRDVSSLTELQELTQEKDVINWIRLDGVHNVKLIEELGKLYKIHPLTVEDILNTTQRAKVDIHDDYIYLVLKKINYDKAAGKFLREQFSVLFLDNTIITIQEYPGDYFSNLEARLQNETSMLRRSEDDYLLYAIIDSLIDHYFVIVEHLENNMEALEEQLDKQSSSLQDIHKLKKELLHVRRSVVPVRDILLFLMKDNGTLISQKTQVYLRDVYDHYVQVHESLEMIRDMVAGMVEVHLSLVSNRMNEIMKYLTVITSIFIPLTFITGIYGMNFVNMPELKWEYGYYITLSVLMLMGIFLYFVFKRKKWL